MTSKEYGTRINFIRDKTERFITALMKRYFSLQLAEVKANLEMGIDPFHDWAHWDKVISDWVEPNVRTALKTAQETALSYTGEKNKITDLHLVFRAGEVMKRLDNVNENTKEKVKAAIDRSKTRGFDSLTQAAIDEVKIIFTTFMTSRSPVIGQTVATAAINSGVDLALNMDANQTVMKTWRAFIDEDTREAHAEADGQTVENDADFIVMGERLRWPGDPFGSPENIINCRCYVEPSI